MTTTTDSTSTSTTALVTGYTRTYISGSSGFDTSALIEAAVEAKLQKAYDLDDKVTKNETKIAAYEEMQGYLQDMLDALDVLRNASGATSTGSVFDTCAAYLTASDGSDATHALAVTVKDGTESQSFTVEVQQIATTHKIGSATQATNDQALSLSGSFTLGTVDGDSATITLTADMSLKDIATAINAETDTSGVRASILKVSDDEYMLVLATTDTGQSISLTDTDGVAQSLGIVDSGGNFATELQAAQDAIVEIDGVTVTSSSNTIENALSGIQLDLYVASAGTTITVEVEPNYADVLEAIEAFVDAYNAYREFAITNQEVDSSGTVSEAAVLFGDSTLRNTSSCIYSALSELIDTDDGSLSLGAIGLTFDENNHLEIDSDTLEEAIVENFESVAKLFEFQFTASSSDLMVLRDDEALASGTYALDITVDGDGAITSVSYNGDDSLFTIDGSTLSGADGSIFEGLKLVFAGDASTTVTFTISQGIADLLYDTLDDIADATSGTLTDMITSLDDQNKDYAKKISNITDRAYAYEEQLIGYYANLETKIALAQSMLDVVEAILDSSDD